MDTYQKHSVAKRGRLGEWPVLCFTGLGWRAWLLLYALPAWFAALKTPASE
jgi:hypothetical protein